MDNIRIGNLIKESRKAKGMTQKELADKLSVTDRAVSKWERGINLPDVSLLIPLSELLGLTVTEIISGQRAGRQDITHTVKSIVDYSENEIAQKNNAFKRKTIRTLFLLLLAFAVTIPTFNRLISGDGFVWRCIPAHLTAKKAAVALENYDKEQIEKYIGNSQNTYSQLEKLAAQDVVILQADTKLGDTKLEDGLLLLEMDFMVRSGDIRYYFTCYGTYRNGKTELMRIVAEDFDKDYPEWMIQLSDALSTYNPG